MIRGVILFVKVFKERKYREDFLEGSLYMNPLKYFKGLKEEKDNNVADAHEGAYRVSQPHELLMSVNGVNLNPKDIIGPVIFNMTWMEQVNVFCMTYLHSHGILNQESFDDDELEKLKSHYKIPTESYHLGDYSVVIHNVPEFLKRVQLALEKLGSVNEIYDYLMKPVEYYDELNDSFSFDEYSIDSAFKKNTRYSHQSEYRIAIVRDNPNSSPFVLQVGDLKDISWVVETTKINQYLKVDAKK